MQDMTREILRCSSPSSTCLVNPSTRGVTNRKRRETFPDDEPSEPKHTTALAGLSPAYPLNRRFSLCTLVELSPERAAQKILSLYICYTSDRCRKCPTRRRCRQRVANRADVVSTTAGSFEMKTAGCLQWRKRGSLGTYPDEGFP